MCTHRAKVQFWWEHSISRQVFSTLLILGYVLNVSMWRQTPVRHLSAWLRWETEILSTKDSVMT